MSDPYVAPYGAQICERKTMGRRKLFRAAPMVPGGTPYPALYRWSGAPQKGVRSVYRGSASMNDIERFVDC